jgi:hypothetical protein
MESEMGKWDKWYDSLPEHTKIYLKGQPVWHDKDLAVVGFLALIVGFVLGYIWR